MIKAFKRLGIKFIYRLIQFNAKLRKPKSIGIRVMVFNKKGQVLLVKHSYRPEYFFPGGGVEKGEGLIEAGMRELREETGLQVNKLELFGTYRYFAEGKDDTVVLLTSKDIVDENDLQIDNVEIIEAGWYDLNSLPIGTHPTHVMRAYEYKEHRNPIVGMW